MFSATPLELIQVEPIDDLDTVPVLNSPGTLQSPGILQSPATLQNPLAGPAQHGTLDPVTNAVAPQTHLQRQGPNLFNDPTVTGTSEWYPFNDAEFDATTSHTADGTGSWKLKTPGGAYSRVITHNFTVQESGKYYISVYMKSENGPSYLGFNLRRFGPTGASLGNSDFVMAGNTQDGVWEEVVVPFDVDVETAPTFSFHLYKRDNLLPGGKVWFDDVFVGKGSPAFEQPPGPKTAFDGASTRVDELGNFEVLRNGTWEPFFPWAVHHNNGRTDWTEYSDMGFNTIMAAQWTYQIEQARDAGMMVGIRLAQYMNGFGQFYNDLDHLANTIDAIKQQGLSEDVLLYYWDNEFAETEWEVPINAVDVIKQHDVDANGDRLHPIYALQGSYNLARIQAANDLVDIQGTYVGGTVDNTGGGTGDTDALTVLQNIQGQDRPSPFAQLNAANTHPGDLRLRVYNALIAGAKAVGYYADHLTGEPWLEDTAWAADMPYLPQEVDALLPIIREPHWTDWAAVTSTNGDVRVGTRDHQGLGYIFLANQRSTAASLTISLEDLPYTAATVVDQLTGEVVGSVTNGTFSLTLAGANIRSGTQVLRLDPVSTSNTAPIAANSAVVASEDTPFTFNVTDFNFTDQQGDARASVTITNQQLGLGALRLNGVTVNNGDTIWSSQLSQLVYTSPSNAYGVSLATFNFTVNDAAPGTVSAQMSINVSNVNDSPTAVAEAYTANLDSVVSGDLSLNDSDIDGDTLAFTLSSGPQNGLVSLASNGTFSFTPTVGFSGRDSFTYSVSDGNNGQTTSTVTIEVGLISHHGNLRQPQEVGPGAGVELPTLPVPVQPPVARSPLTGTAVTGDNFLLPELELYAGKATESGAATVDGVDGTAQDVEPVEEALPAPELSSNVLLTATSSGGPVLPESLVPQSVRTLTTRTDIASVEMSAKLGRPDGLVPAVSSEVRFGDRAREDQAIDWTAVPEIVVGVDTGGPVSSTTLVVSRNGEALAQPDDPEENTEQQDSFAAVNTVVVVAASAAQCVFEKRAVAFATQNTSLPGTQGCMPIGTG
jgi:hypothetical protein